MDVQLPIFHWGLLTAGLVVASVYDVRLRRVPNWLSVGVATCGLVSRCLTINLICGAWGLLGIVVGLVILLFPFARGWIGGGDVKLLAACGAWMGPLLVIYGALFGAVFGGLIALIYLFRTPPKERRQIIDNLKYSLLLKTMPEAKARSARLSPPYAPAISLGTLLTAYLHAQHLI
jgi:prepilin peptidase CpaA